MKRLWIYAHAVIAAGAWVFILAVLGVALLETDSALAQNPIAMMIAILVTAGHLSSASYLVHRVRTEIEGLRASRMPRPEASTASPRR